MYFNVTAKTVVSPRIFCCFIPPPSTRHGEFLCIILIDIYLWEFRLSINLHLSSTILHPWKTWIISNIQTTHYLDNTYYFKIIIYGYTVIVIFNKTARAFIDVNVHFKYVNIPWYLFTFTVVKINRKPFRGKSTVVREKLRTAKKNYSSRIINFPWREIFSHGGDF